MKILVVEPYYAGSHAAWVDGYAASSRHEVRTLTLPGRFWKWRMHGAAVTMARRFLAMDWLPDLLLTTDMLDLTTFLSLTRHHAPGIPTAGYFHENQLTYPWLETDRDVKHERNLSYAFINYVSALAADAVLFNSQFHLNSFLDALPRLLKHFPDFNELDTVGVIRAKSRVLPLGLDLKRLDAFRPASAATDGGTESPIILWNHRWEYDKNPEDFFRLLDLLIGRRVDFRVALLGESYRQQPTEFQLAASRLGECVVHMGYVTGTAEYAGWLWGASLLPVTSHHDFFGASVTEAIYCGCFPLLPKRLSYPELIPEEYHQECFYSDMNDLVDKSVSHLMGLHRPELSGLRQSASTCDWSRQASTYDEVFEQLYRSSVGNN